MEVLAGIAIIGLMGMVVLLIVMKDRQDKRSLAAAKDFTAAIKENTKVIQDLRAAIVSENQNHNLVIRMLGEMKAKQA